MCTLISNEFISDTQKEEELAQKKYKEINASLIKKNCANFQRFKRFIGINLPQDALEYYQMQAKSKNRQKASDAYYNMGLIYQIMNQGNDGRARLYNVNHYYVQAAIRGHVKAFERICHIFNFADIQRCVKDLKKYTR